MTAYLITCSILFGLLFFVWSKSSLLNALIKFTFLGMTCWSVFLWMQDAGYVIKEQPATVKPVCDSSKVGFMGETCEK